MQIRGRKEGEGAFRVEKWATWQCLVLVLHGVRTEINGLKREKSGFL